MECDLQLECTALYSVARIERFMLTGGPSPPVGSGLSPVSLGLANSCPEILFRPELQRLCLIITQLETTGPNVPHYIPTSHRPDMLITLLVTNSHGENCR